MKSARLAFLGISIVFMSAASAQVGPQTFVPANTPTPAATPAPRAALSSGNRLAISSPNPRPQLDEQTSAGEKLPQLNFVVDVLALLTTVLAIVSGYTVYKSHRDAAEAKRVADATLTEAKSILDSCVPLHTKLQTLHDQIIREVKEDKATFTSELERDKTSFMEDVKEAKASFAERMEAELDLFRRQLHEAATINRTKTRLMELLASDAPNADEIFPLLTDILDYPDQRSIEIYERLLEGFGKDDQIVSKVMLGLRMFRERHYK